MTVDAVIREWNTDEGWGVIDSPETPGGCWAHFSSAAISGFVRFESGQPVRLEWQAPGQDGYPFRAVRFWPADRAPQERTSAPADRAYSSTLSLTFDDPDDAAGPTGSS